ncbi:MAG: AraC family transcriptional regulator [Lachnospiraceae bacterium]|nr:AraC family transcriptional regulator [Lachnospiraceae bacterium]
MNPYLTIRNKPEQGKPVTNDALKEQGHGFENAYSFHYFRNVFEWDANECFNWHWHDEFEISYVNCEELICDIENEHIHLHKGDCLFINSRTLHQYTCVSKELSVGMWDSILFRPELIAPADSLLYQKYVSPIIHSDRSYLLFRKEDEWQNEILKFIEDAYRICEENNYFSELQLQTCLLTFWQLLASHQELFPPMNSESPSCLDQERLRAMLKFIWNNYHRNISLENIADAAFISVRTAQRCFRKTIQTTPLLYLQNYRLLCAKGKLLSSSGTILETALSCGFESSSYFDRIFKKVYNETPRQYIKRMKNAPSQTDEEH